ncbi:hypothetical protein HMI54_010838 [Coelomomyces lativittatus]|nr:hypothetical protein HMI54_010838 [Coelomomyces lativittatus]KAJ1514717.1 hypothetical protein HMI56_007587 [Coelomomyces lativittatus]KAJ1517751.1 hypothetical protein HMI55_006110 [Coelomomyces lativittatus]
MRFQLWLSFFLFTFISILERDVNAILGRTNTKGSLKLKYARMLSDSVSEELYSFKPKYYYASFASKVPEEPRYTANFNLQDTKHFEKTTEDRIMDIQDSDDSREKSAVERRLTALSQLFKETKKNWKERIKTLDSKNSTGK